MIDRLLDTLARALLAIGHRLIEHGDDLLADLDE